MSCRNDPAPPNTVPQAATPTNCTSSTCPPCCCCVTSAVIENVRNFGPEGFGTGTYYGGIVASNGHAFDFRIQMTFAAGATGRSDCVMEWWERVNLPAITGHTAGTWTDMLALVPNSPTFGPWGSRVTPCPGGGNLTVTITDPPSLGNAPGRTQTRTLEFRLVVRSSGGCGCGLTSATATATQVLVMVNGVLDTNASSFTIGPSSTTP